MVRVRCTTCPVALRWSVRAGSRAMHACSMATGWLPCVHLHVTAQCLSGHHVSSPMSQLARPPDQHACTCTWATARRDPPCIEIYRSRCRPFLFFVHRKKTSHTHDEKDRHRDGRPAVGWLESAHDEPAARGKSQLAMACWTVKLCAWM